VLLPGATLTPSVRVFAYIVLTVPGVLCAQRDAQVVLPGYFASFEGNSSSSYPFSAAAHRMQQIHNDARGNAMAGVRGWAIRRDGITTLVSGAPRRVDVELAMADGDAANASTTFASNYVNPPTAVFQRKLVNLPDRSPAPGQKPMPWDVVFLFDNQWVYSGTHDLLWEIKVFSNTLSGAGNEYWSDFAPQNAAVIPAMDFPVGSGCLTNASTTLPMTLEGASRVERATGRLLLGWDGLRAPRNEALVVVVVGGQGASFPVPGLCGDGRLYVVPLITLPAGPASSSGSFVPPPGRVPWSPALARADLFAQAAAVDSSQPGLPIAVSNGLRTSMPPGPPPSFLITRVHHFSDANATTGLVTTGGLVVRFDY
jgi:hypothetical protein